MSVFQIEQYYIHLELKSVPTKVLNKIGAYLVENDLGDHQISVSMLVIDGFECKREAAIHEESIVKIINQEEEGE